MGTIITINNLTFDYAEKQIFENLNLEIKKGSFVTILGTGKTTLLDLISGTLNAEGAIKITKEAESEIGIIFKESLILKGETVEKAILSMLEDFKVNQVKLIERIKYYFNKLDVTYLPAKNIKSLTGEEKQIISTVITLIKNPQIIIMNSKLSKLSKTTKEKLLILLSTLDNTILHATNDIEEALYGEEIIILNNKKAIFHGTTKAILSKTEILEKLNIDLPFTVKLSRQLKFYNVLDKDYYSMEDLVNAIWK